MVGCVVGSSRKSCTVDESAIVAERGEVGSAPFAVPKRRGLSALPPTCVIEGAHFEL